MTVIDTNILIRLATRDVAGLAEQADVMVSVLPPRSIVVMAAVVEEYCFVLEKNKAYLFDRDFVAGSLTTLLKRPQFIVSEAIREALEMFRTHRKLDFVDCLLAVKTGGKKGQVLTFDKELQAVLR